MIQENNDFKDKIIMSIDEVIPVVIELIQSGLNEMIELKAKDGYPKYLTEFDIKTFFENIKLDK